MRNELTPDERRLLAADDKATDRVGIWLAAILGLPVVAVVIIVIQSVIWLKTGAWPSLSIADAFRWANVGLLGTGWLGFDRVLGYLFDCPVSGVLIVADVAAVLAFTWGDGRAEPDALREARRKRANLYAGRRVF